MYLLIIAAFYLYQLFERLFYFSTFEISNFQIKLIYNIGSFLKCESVLEKFSLIIPLPYQISSVRP